MKEQGIKLFFCDLDNTLVPHFKIMPTEEVLKFIDNVRAQGMTFVLLSNNFNKRVRFFAQKSFIKHYFGMVKKPSTKIVKKFMKNHNFKPYETIVMGDQLVTDILMANRLKLESILVQPIMNTDLKLNSLNRFLER